MIGRRLNNFEITRLLGEGGMSEVFEAQHAMIDRRVAIKVLRREMSSNESLVTRFFNEARATNAIGHPNIIEIIDVGRFEDGVPYLVMELLEGETLAQRLHRTGRLELRVAVELVARAALALQAAHEKGIVHRDLKPEHVFLVPDPLLPGTEHFKLLDFGIAKLWGEVGSASVRTKAGTVLGTPQYMSPEQCLGLPHGVDHRADIYALGIILYEALAGQPPFNSPGYGDVMMMQLRDTPRPLSERRPDVPATLEQIVLKALAKNRSDRHQTMIELARALQECLRDELAGPVPPRASGEPPVAKAVIAAGDAPATKSLSEEPAPHSVNLPLRTIAGPGGPPVPSPPWDGADASEPTSARRQRARRARRAAALSGALGALIGIVLLWRSQADEPQRVTQHSAPAASMIPAPDALTSHAPMSAGPAANSVASTAGAAQAPASLASPSAPAAPPGAKAQRPATAAALELVAQATRPGAAPPERAGLASAGPAGAPKNEASAKTSLPPAVVDPTPLAAHLSLDSSPWSEVFLGSQLLGTTPLIDVTIPAGRQVLTLTNSELGISTTYVVNIKPGTSLKRFVGWGPE